MKSFQNILSIIALFALNPVNARRASTRIPKPTLQPQPILTKAINQPLVQKQSPIQQQPTIEKQSYKNLVTDVKSSNNVWDNTRELLRADFVTTMIQKARTANLDAIQLEALLQTARDFHGKFSGNAAQDIAILQSVNNQIAAAIK